jgi:hypothetical protein
MKTVRRGLYIVLFVALTALTQVGGVALFATTMIVWAAVPEHKLSGLRALPVHVVVFIAVYAAIWMFLPGIAQHGGRVPLQCLATAQAPYAAYSPLHCLFNRNYADPRAKALLERYSREVAEAYPGTITAYLDAGFPVFDWFPLPPHSSHDDGLAFDLAYYYTDAEGRHLPLRAPSPIGYWAFETPRAGEEDVCAGVQDRLTLRWDLDWLQGMRAPYLLDEARTGFMLRWLVEHGREYGVERLFIEPHLAARLGVASDLIGFAGCRTARHDDHLHVGLAEP